MKGDNTEEENLVEEIPFFDIKFRDACGLLGGRYKDLGDDLKVCEVQKGLASYVVIEKQGRGIEVYTKSPKGIEHIADLDRIDHTFCYVAVDLLEDTPLGSVCNFYKELRKLSREDYVSNGEDMNVTVEPPRSIVVSRVYLAVRDKEGRIIPIVFGHRNIIRRIKVNPSFRGAFKEIYEETVKKELDRIEREILKR